MQKVDAIRIDGMVLGAMGHLDAIAHHVKSCAKDEDEARRMIRALGTAMAALMDISAEVHRQYTDTIPPHLVPD